MPRMNTRRMLSIGAAVLALLVASACIHFSRANAFQKATNLGDYERQMWEHVKAGRWNDVRAHIAETYVCTMPNGAHSRAEMLNFLQSLKLDGFDIQNLKSSPNGADMVVTYDLELRGMSSGQPIPPGRVHVLTVWQSVKRGWIEVAQSITTEGQWPAGPAMFKPQ
jgi:hypothetical protein